MLGLYEALNYSPFSKVFEGVNVKLSEESFTGDFLQKVHTDYKTQTNHQYKGEQMENNFFNELISGLIERHADKGSSVEQVTTGVKTALSIEGLVNNLAEIFRTSKSDIESDLEALGLSSALEQYRLANLSDTGAADDSIVLADESKNEFSELFGVYSNPRVNEPSPISSGLKKALEGIFASAPSMIRNDPFIDAYRNGTAEYYESFKTEVAPMIDSEIEKLFGKGQYPKYMITTGIGANEQFTHFVSEYNNRQANKRLTWYIINSPKNLTMLPEDATVENTLFLEFSRSSMTEETVKLHEYTSRECKRIVFSNKGPLKDIGLRDGNLVLRLPDNISGRYGRNKTPILLAPMYIAGLDTDKYWNDIMRAINAWDLADENSLPFVIAKFILTEQRKSGRNFIYFGCNDEDLGLMADEFIQFWNEGVNKNGNDIMMSRFFGLPRDSHMNIEGILGNKDTKMGVFLLRTNMRNRIAHPLVKNVIDPMNEKHAGLILGDEEVILGMANYRRFSEVMPALLIEIPGEPTLEHSAIIGQLFADVTYVYSRMVGIDPGSNPEVKFVRERSAGLLADIAQDIRSGESIEDAIKKYC